MNLKTARRILGGLRTHVPGMYRTESGGTGGTSSARYCYSVWLRHLRMAASNRLNTDPKVIAELGPGDTIGIGLAALLTGAEKYYALDVVEYARTGRNLKIFDELVELFAARAPIPDAEEFPRTRPMLDSYQFPHDVANKGRLTTALHKDRIRAVRNAVANPGAERTANAEIRYFVPWDDAAVIRPRTVDMVYSQAVLEHVDDLPRTYAALHAWLRPDGFMSHTIDFRCHGQAEQWNGHWAYSDATWKLIRGSRPFLLNRQPRSTHIRLLQEHGFKIVCEVPVKGPPGIHRSELAKPFRALSDQDLHTSGTFIQAVRSS
ncbi:MAG: methyltransferase domain-containing protein [Phycisphaerae bacterium]